jgi:hypothetical protein
LSLRSALILSLALAGLIVAGVLVRTGRQDRARLPEADDHAGMLDKLRSVPYTAVTSYESDPREAGVRIYEADRVRPGYNLYCSRTDPEAYLMDMEGKIVHTWARPGDDIWVWERAVMLPNGDLMVASKFKELLRLDPNSEIVWQAKMDVHHDIAFLPDGSFYTVIRGAELYRSLAVEFPVIVHCAPSGEEIDRWYAYDHMDEIMRRFDRSSFLDTVLDSMIAAGETAGFTESVPGRVEANRLKNGRVLYDYFHLNTVTVLPETALGERDSRFRAGNLLVCFRNIDQVAVLDADTWEISWVWGEGELEWPHDPTMVEDGNILIFDNGVRRGFSRVVEVDPVKGDIVWQYVAHPPESFYSFEKGSAQRLAGGNTLICDGDNGRAFEVTPAGEVVWEWLNPVMKNGHRVQVYRMTRLTPEEVEPLFQRTGR